MMKSQMSLDLVGLFECLMTDVQRWTPLTDQEIVRDISTVSHLVNTRGVQYLLITFPDVGKVFDQSLAKGMLLPLPFAGFSSRKKRSKVPRLLSGLFSKVFSDDGLLLEEPDVAAITALRQIFYCFKKVRMECDDKTVTATYRDFVDTDRALRSPSLLWDDSDFDGLCDRRLHLSDGPSEHSCDESHESELSESDLWDIRSVLGSIQYYADRTICSFPEFSEKYRPGHGTGAVSDLRVGKDFKYLFPTWPDRLEREFPMADFASANYATWNSWQKDGLFENIETPSRLLTVPKTLKAPRLIACEPTSLQYCQQAVLDYLVDGVTGSHLRNCIDFTRQDLNGDWALTASDTGDHATVDLSSASDRVSLWLVERIFRSRPDILRLLQATRSLSTVVPNYGPLLLKKFTTMGAATTFPVQSIVFSIVIGGVLLHEAEANKDSTRHGIMDAMLKGSHTFRVFGDDLIVPIHVVSTVIKVLEHLGLKVNTAKTFVEGNFRESCGVDAFAGVDVTPAYVLQAYDRTTPTSYGSVVEQANNFHKKGLWSFASALLRTVPQKIQKDLPVVPVESGILGIVSFCGVSISHLRKKWDDATQQEVVSTVALKQSSRRRYAGEDGSLLQYFLEDPSQDIQWMSGIDCRCPGRVTRAWRPIRFIT